MTTHPTDMTHGATGDERRMFHRAHAAGREAGRQQCATTHGERDSRWYRLGIRYGLRSAEKRAYRRGRRRGAWLALGAVGLLVAVAAATGRGR